MESRIFKYYLDTTDRQMVTMPVGAQILSVGVRHTSLCLWARVPFPCGQEYEHPILIVGTGNPIPPVGKFLGTHQIDGLVCHVFDGSAASLINGTIQ